MNKNQFDIKAVENLFTHWSHPAFGKHVVFGPVSFYAKAIMKPTETRGEMNYYLMIDSINVEEDEQHKGHFTRLIGLLEKFGSKYGIAIWVNSVVNPILADCLERRGYTSAKIDGCYYIPPKGKTLWKSVSVGTAMSEKVTV